MRVTLPHMHLQPGDRIIFQGDSITDAGRTGGSAPWGDGWVAILAARFLTELPELRLDVLNRGVGGDRTVELLERWTRDVVELKPQVLSLMIGVNDCWRKYGVWNGQTWVTPEMYRANLEQLCDRALAAGVRSLVLMSPTTIARENRDPANELLGEYAAIARGIASSRRALWVDCRTPLLQARAQRPGVPWTPDGCHPTVAGHAILASAWWRVVVG